MKVPTYKLCTIDVPDDVKIDHTMCTFEPSDDPRSDIIGSYKHKTEEYLTSMVLERRLDGVKIKLFLSHQNDDKGIRTTYWIVDDMRSLKKYIEVHANILTQWIREMKGE